MNLPQQPRVVFIIVTWNRKKLLDQCLRSLRKFIRSSYKIIVIDNASADGSQKHIKETYPEVILIENAKNLGFSKANNIGIDHIRTHKINSDYIIFLNNDTEFRDNSVEVLLDHMDKNSNIKAAIPTIMHERHIYQTGTGGYELTLSTAFNYCFFLSILFPTRFKGFFFHQKYFRQRGIIPEIDWLSGVCLVSESKTVLKTRGFPEDFFMYAEDIAFSRDLRKSGKLIYYPFARIFHLKEDIPSRKINTTWLDSLFKYYKNQPSGPFRLFSLKMIFFMGFMLRFIVYSMVAVFAKNRGLQKARELKAYSYHVLKCIFSFK